MPLLSLLRLVFSLLSWAVLGASIYLLAEWYDGSVLVREADGELVRQREPWMLALGVALLAFSVLGRWLVVPLVARPDSDPTWPERGGGRLIRSPTGAELYIETSGAAGLPTLVLTHGWALDSTIWRSGRRALGQRFRIVTWDLPGLGKSRPASAAGIDLASFAQDLAAVIEASGAPRVALVGHSIGGMIIQTLARDRPDLFDWRVAGSVLLNTTYTNPLRTMVLSGLMQALRWPLLEPIMRLTIVLEPLAWLSAWQSYFSGSAHLANRLGFGRFVTRSQLEHTTLLSTRNSQAHIARGNLAMFAWDARGAMASVSPPLLVISGEVDIVTLPSAGAAIAAATPGAQHVPIGGVNHMGFLELAPRYHDEIAAFAAACLAEAPVPPA